MVKRYKKGTVESLILSVLVFIAVSLVIRYLSYQQYLIAKKNEHEQLQQELNRVKDGFRSILYSDVTVANALAVIQKNYRDSYNFDSVARQLMEANKYVEAMQITRGGVITHVYPHEGYDNTVGINTLADSLRKKEAESAVQRSDIYFAGPRKLRLGGIGILGKVPIFSNGELIGFSVVLTKLPTIVAALGLNDSSKQIYSYELTKNNSVDSAGYYFTKLVPRAKSTSVSTQIPEGNWTLTVSYSSIAGSNNFPVVQTVLGFLLALFAGVFAYRRIRQPYYLNEIIDLKTKEISAKEKYYRTITEANYDATVLLDGRGRVLYQTPSTEKITGYSLDQIQKTDGLELIHPEERARTNKAFLNLINKTGAILQLTHRLKHKNGNYIWIECTYRNMLHDENIHAIVLNYHDITDKVVAQHQLGERVKELTTIYYTNEILKDDQQSADDVFRKIVEILPPGWQYPEVCAARIIFDGQEIRTANYRASDFVQTELFVLEDGRQGAIEVIYTEKMPIEYEGPFLKEERDLIMALAETIKVHFNKAIQQKGLARSEANLRSIFDNSEILYLLLDSDFQVIALNQRMRDIYHEVAGQVLKPGVSLPEILLPEKRETALEVYNKVKNEKRTILYETRYDLQGQPNYFMANVVPIITNSEVVGICVSSVEITKLKHLEFEREKFISDLVDRNRDLQEFAQIVSHNLRGPLATLLGLNNMLKDGVTEEEKDFIMDGIVLSSERLDAVVIELNNILNVKHNSSESMEMVNLDTLLEEIKQKFSDLIVKKSAGIYVDFSAVNELFTMRSYIYNILYNLLSNSLKYTDKNRIPQIRIWTEHRQGKILLGIKDNGIGIDMNKHHDQIFLLNRRFHNTSDGKGLGLYIVKAQVDILRGTIEMDSEPGIGTTVRIMLPAVLPDGQKGIIGNQQ